MAFVLNCSYEKALHFFKDGERRADSSSFLCKELLAALRKNKKAYAYKYTGQNKKWLGYEDDTIVFIERSKKYPVGHYLCRYKNKWMDHWINFPQNKDILCAKSGFRKHLPDRPIYIILPRH